MNTNKTAIMILVFAFAVSKALSQETKQVKHFISSTLVEKYEVLKTDKHTRTGRYSVSDLDNHVFVLGQYKNGKKDSIWNYANESGTIIQKYNYTDSTFLMNNADNTGMIQTNYKIEENAIVNGAKASPPCQVGGKNYGFYLLYDPKSIPPQVQNQTSVVKMTYSLSLDSAGKVQDAKVIYAGPGIDYQESIPVKNFSSDIYTFLPARIDDKAVNSNLSYSVDLNINKSRSQRQYTTPTNDSKMNQGINH